jgi:hypothetical protein
MDFSTQQQPRSAKPLCAALFVRGYFVSIFLLSLSSLRVGTRSHRLASATAFSSGFTNQAYPSSSRRTALAMSSLTPPPARREEDRVIYAGGAPPGWDPSHPRKAQDSEEELMDPPVGIKGTAMM